MNEYHIYFLRPDGSEGMGMVEAATERAAEAKWRLRYPDKRSITLVQYFCPVSLATGHCEILHGSRGC